MDFGTSHKANIIKVKPGERKPWGHLGHGKCGYRGGCDREAGEEDDSESSQAWWNHCAWNHDS